MSDQAIANEVGVSRQFVSKIRRPLRIAKATENSADATSANRADQFASLHPGSPQPAAAPLLLVEVEWPAWAESADVIAARLDDPRQHFDADRLRAVVTYRMNAVSKEGAWRAVGIDPDTGADWHRRDRGLRRVIDWAVGLVELRIASSMLRLASGVGPQAAQAATLIAERQLGWTKESTLRIEGELHERIDIRAIMASPRAIELASAMEAELQMAEDRAAGLLPAHDSNVIDAEFIERPDLPDAQVTLIDEDEKLTA